MSDQQLVWVQESLTEFYRRIEREWKESQRDAALSFNELAAMYGCLGDGAFTDDYRQLAELELEAGDTG